MFWRCAVADFEPRDTLGRTLGPVAQGAGAQAMDAEALVREADRLRREDGLAIKAAFQALVDRIHKLEELAGL